MTELERLQQWVQASIMAPAPPASAEAGVVVRPSHSLTPIERLEIYRGMYEGRLLDALLVDYPRLHQVLGPDHFLSVAQLYVRRYPSRSYTLNRLGDEFPGFLGQVKGLPRPRFLRDLARLELAQTQVFDEEHTPTAGPEAIQSIPASQWESLRLQPIAALRLLALEYPAHRDCESGIPRRRDTFLAVYRRDFALMHLELTRASYALLEALCQGRPLGEALTTVRIPTGRIFECFRTWFSEGLFQTPQCQGHKE